MRERENLLQVHLDYTALVGGTGEPDIPIGDQGWSIGISWYNVTITSNDNI